MIEHRNLLHWPIALGATKPDPEKWIEIWLSKPVKSADQRSA
jgi:hypothetical protein